MDTFNYDNSNHADAPAQQNDTTFGGPAARAEQDRTIAGWERDDADAPTSDEQAQALAMFGDSQLRDRTAKVLDDLPFRANDGSPLSQDQREAAARTVAQIGEDLGLSDPEFNHFLSLSKNPLPVAEQRKQEVEVIREFESQYGKAEAAHRLNLARQLAARSPVFQKWCEISGHGSSKDVVRMLAEKAWSMAARGEL